MLSIFTSSGSGEGKDEISGHLFTYHKFNKREEFSKDKKTKKNKNNHLISIYFQNWVSLLSTAPFNLKHSEMY